MLVVVVSSLGGFGIISITIYERRIRVYLIVYKIKRLLLGFY